MGLVHYILHIIKYIFFSDVHDKNFDLCSFNVLIYFFPNDDLNFAKDCLMVQCYDVHASEEHLV